MSKIWGDRKRPPLGKRVKSRGWAKRIFQLDPKSPGKEIGPFVEGALKDGALVPIKGIR